MDESQDDATGHAATEDGDGSIIDIRQYLADRRSIEQRLLRIHKLAAIGQLAGGIAHDFNNLLAIIDAQLELVEEELAGQPALREQVAAGRRVVGRSASLARAMLLALRDQELQPEAFDPIRVVDGFIELARHALGRRIRIQCDHALGLWLCRADPTQVMNALLNLAVNARDAMPNGGTFSIATRNEFIASVGASAPGATAGDYVVIEVADDGSGMTQEVLAKACDPFFTTKAAHRGSGLGLAMVQGFVQRSGGFLQIESMLGTGTRVRIWLPRASAADMASSPSGDGTQNKPQA